MRGNCQTFRAVFQCQIVQTQVLCGHILHFGIALLEEVLVIRVSDHAPCAVVKLDIAAASGIQLLNDGAVGGSNILNQLFVVGVNSIRIFAIVLTVQFGQ